MYVIEFTENARQDIILLQRNAPQAVKKVFKLIEELREHPRSGTGQVEQLKYLKNETWSRRITREHRLVYEIHDEQILVLVISSYGHYDNK
jgi:toxin YoeB